MRSISACPEQVRIAELVCDVHEPAVENQSGGNDNDHDMAAASLRDRVRPHLKRAIDVAGALTLILFLLPLLLLLFVVIKLDGGPAIYQHARVGRHGAVFPCRKFRTMVQDADDVLKQLLLHDEQARQEWEHSRKLRRDPRVTPVGRILRAASLDELPQLFNVLEGTMSLVGPRPVTTAELRTFYGDAATEYMAVLPGLTGPWQVSGRSEMAYAERVDLDVRYSQNQSIRTDVKILLLTIPAVLNRRGAY